MESHLHILPKMKDSAIIIYLITVWYRIEAEISGLEPMVMACQNIMENPFLILPKKMASLILQKQNAWLMILFLAPYRIKATIFGSVQMAGACQNTTEIPLRILLKKKDLVIITLRVSCRTKPGIFGSVL